MINKYVRPFLLVLAFLIWVAERIQFPGQKQGADKRKWVLDTLTEKIDLLLPDTVVGKWLEAALVKAIGLALDYVVGKINKSGEFAQIDKVLGELFPAASGT